MPEEKEERNVIQIWVSANEKEVIERAAEEDKRSISQYCRIIILDKINEFREHKK